MNVQPIPVTGQLAAQCTVDRESLAMALKIAALRLADYSDTYDDGGSSWMTYHCQRTGKRFTYLADDDAPFSTETRVAQIIDVMNIFMYDMSLHLDPDDFQSRLTAYRAQLADLYDAPESVPT